MISTRKDFRMWLLRNDYTQQTLADKLGISVTTISKYSCSERFPIVFKLALEFLDNKDSE